MAKIGDSYIDMRNMLGLLDASVVSMPSYKFAPGMQVVLVKLSKAEYNGHIATIDSLPDLEGSGRWPVKLVSSGKMLAVKEANIESVDDHVDDVVCNACGKKQLPESEIEPFKRCARCVDEKLTPACYCSKDCQKADWPAHKTWHKDRAFFYGGLNRAVSEGAASSVEYCADVFNSTGCEYHALAAAGARALTTGNFKAAATNYKTALSVAPQGYLGEAHYNAGLSLRHSGQDRKAAPLFLAASEYHVRGGFKWAEAVVATIPLYLKYMDLQPRPLWMRTASACIEIAEECTAAAPESAVAWQALGLSLTTAPMLCDSKRPDAAASTKAATVFEKAASLSPPGSSQEAQMRFASQAAYGSANGGRGFAADTPMAQRMVKQGARVFGMENDPKVKELLRKGAEQMNRELSVGKRARSRCTQALI